MERSSLLRLVNAVTPINLPEGLLSSLARDESNPSGKLIGVTALTSLNNDDLSIYNFNERSSLVNHLALKAYNCGMDGIVCSPGDISKIGISDDDFQYVTPGIRLNQNKDDHAQAFTPQDAVKLGAPNFTASCGVNACA